jgi:hypothetical protein
LSLHDFRLVGHGEARIFIKCGERAGCRFGWKRRGAGLMNNALAVLKSSFHRRTAVKFFHAGGVFRFANFNN